MTNDQLVNLLGPFLSSSAGIAVFLYLAKEKLTKYDRAADASLKTESKVETMNEKLIEIKVELEKLEKMREEFILLKAETKAQWRHIDELKKDFRELSQ